MSETGARLLVDWGTTNLRAFLVTDDGVILDRQVSDRGILSVEAAVMPSVLDELAAPWSEEIGDRPAVLCGMVGSANGWHEVPYADCPAAFDDLPKAAAKLHSAAGRAVFILPGLTRRRELAPGLSQADVMRGEETQIFGALSCLERGDATFCLPGTHSKWALAKDGSCVDFATYFTGELYSVLSQHSLLGRLMKPPQEVAEKGLPAGFARGLATAKASDGLSGTLFATRADILAGLMTGAEGAGYLSGLLIGMEIREALPRFAPAGPIVVVGAHGLVPLYLAALEDAGAAVEALDGEAAVVAGLLRAARILES
ncbi:2-dehydro-3-deoxygalactonokinase [Pelagibius sp. Alg239-R121]|uniref:2-dehydro-3-deoxygalactonokinase n=1 Tax=Pelagibius sp. Alg239-R121 TaxID=2993448 RepID=UPI0024A615EC|nr:2-dehydro-3-deoxygalactonokinase [Pelagibius sp. Alg239-R121]